MEKMVWERSDFFDHVKRYILVCIHEDDKDYSHFVCKRHIYILHSTSICSFPRFIEFQMLQIFSQNFLPQAMTCVGLMFGQKCLKRSNSNSLPHFKGTLISWSCFHGQFYSCFHRLHGMTPLESWKENRCSLEFGPVGSKSFCEILNRK